MKTCKWGWVLFLLGGVLLARSSSANDWQVDQQTSTIGFVATYDEISFEGFFTDFTADIHFDSTSPTGGSFEVNISIASVDTNSTDRDEGMLEADWFDAEQFPRAGFSSTAFERLDSGNDFSVTGELTIKGITRPVKLEFTWVETGPSARLKGQANVKRSDFKLGAGDWAEDDTIGFEVRIVFDLKLAR
jgi:polyisoprenoid-binding protein YceI